jgi:hypothetical protein
MGLRSGDVLVLFNGHRIHEYDDFVRVLDTIVPGDFVTFSIRRGGKEEHLPPCRTLITRISLMMRNCDCCRHAYVRMCRPCAFLEL